MGKSLALSRIALFCIGACSGVHCFADENSSKPSSQSEVKQHIICKTSEEAKRLCLKSIQVPPRISLKQFQKKSLVLNYSNSTIASLQSQLSLDRKRIYIPTFSLNMQDESPILGLGLINQEILRISFILGTDLDIEQATAEELLQSLTDFELKPQFGLGFEGFW